MMKFMLNMIKYDKKYGNMKNKRFIYCRDDKEPDRDSTGSLVGEMSGDGGKQ